MLTVAATLVGFTVTTLAESPASMLAFLIVGVLAVVLDTSWRAVRDRRLAARERSTSRAA